MKIPEVPPPVQENVQVQMYGYVLDRIDTMLPAVPRMREEARITGEKVDRQRQEVEKLEKKVASTTNGKDREEADKLLQEATKLLAESTAANAKATEELQKTEQELSVLQGMYRTYETAKAETGK
jgi:hypothetical protein